MGAWPLMFSYIQVTRKNATEMTFVRKIRTNNVDEIDTWPLMFSQRKFVCVAHKGDSK